VRRCIDLVILKGDGAVSSRIQRADNFFYEREVTKKLILLFI